MVWEEGKELVTGGRQGLQGGEHVKTGRGVGCGRRRHLRAIHTLRG